MSEISSATELGRSELAADRDTARAQLLALWERVGPTGDALHRCTLAHYLADLYDEPAEALRWNVRALDAADALTDSRAREHDGRLSVAGFYPSLHLNLAEDLRRLGAFDAAGAQLAAARRHEHVLGDDDYGAMLRQAFDDVSRAITARSVSPLPVTGSR